MEKWQDPQVIALWIAIIVVLVFTILFFVIWIMYTGYKRMTEANLREAQTALEHQKKLLETNLQAQEKERERIAADLHDSLIGKLSVIRLKSQTGVAINDIDEMLGESIAEARRISHDLTPPLIAFSNIEDLIDNVVSPWQQKLNITYYKDVRTAAALSPEIKIQLIRVAQELVTNINKHAQATAVVIHLRHTNKNFILLVKDNGRGYEAGQLKKGLGLHSLELRMQYLNAKYRVTSAQGKGTATLIVVPAT
ncbi:sensor histidine kinase [Flavobacterium rivuli]|uniref:sensor histidine kinase n=1 Tax=Flavobacterium rivuli TaxID=498301 RepID=UPI000373DDFA|nr:histidine kinase [Flavobacterium rivuli]